MAEDLGALIASLGADMSDLQKTIIRAKNTLKEYDSTVNKELKQAESRFVSFSTGASKALHVVRRSVFSLKGALVGIGAGMVLRGFTNIAGSFEQMRIKLDAITKGRGLQTLEEINRWAIEMPINTMTAVDAFTTMNAMGLKPTIKMMETLVDVSVLFGKDALPRIALALGQMQAMAKLTAQDLNQLAQVGVNARRYLREAFGTSTAEEINKMGIAIEDVIKVIVTGMEQEFGGSARKMMDTWQGVTAFFESMITEISRQFASAGAFQAIKDTIASISSEMQKWLKAQTELKNMGLPNWFDDVAEAAKGVARMLITIAKYANLRSITGTIKQGFELSGQGRLGMSFNEFLKKGFLERQQIVDQALKRSAGEGQVFRGSIKNAVGYNEYLQDFAKPSKGSSTSETLAKMGQQILGKGTGNAFSADEFTKTIQYLQTQRELLTMTKAEQIAYNAAQKLNIEIGSEKYKQILEEAQAYQLVVDSIQSRKQLESELSNIEQELLSKQEQITQSYENRVKIINKAAAEGLVSETKAAELIAKAYKKMNREIADTSRKTFEEDLINAINSWSSTWASALNDMAWGADITFDNILESFSKMLTQMLIQQAVIQPFLGWAGGVFKASAKGNMFDKGNIVPYAKGGVVSQPTIFPMAEGAGLMGEDGPEAVLPLKRTSTGELGVVAENNNNASKQVVVNINAIDSKSFVEVMQRNPQAIIGPIIQEIYKGNVVLRNAIRKAG